MPTRSSTASRRHPCPHACRTSCAAPSRAVALSSSPAAAQRREDDVLDEIRAIHRGGGTGSIIGRNTFQRPKHEALGMLKRIAATYRGEVA